MKSLISGYNVEVGPAAGLTADAHVSDDKRRPRHNCRARVVKKFLRNGQLLGQLLDIRRAGVTEARC
jgi:hypothetical protein